MLWWIVISFIFQIITLLLSRIYITIDYTYMQDEQLLCIKVHLYRIRIYKKEVRIIGDEDSDIWDVLKQLKSSLDMATFQERFKKFIQTLHDVKNITIALLEKIRFHKVSWKTVAGTGDAISTGLAAGGIWSVKGWLIGLLHELGNMKCEPQISVDPLFQQKLIQSKIDCIVSIKVGQAIYAAFKLIRKIPTKKEAFA